MNGNNVLLDTNIVLYLLNGDKALQKFLMGRRLFVSFITELECLGYSGLTAKEVKATELFLSECQLIDINKQIKTEVISLRRTTSLKLPDCIIAATASHLGMTLITADRHFKPLENVNVVFYQSE
jgi:predicted nucleic acid-binding protein